MIHSSRLFFLSLSAMIGCLMVGVFGVSAETAAPNEMGLIPVLEYHHVGPKESRWTRSYENFRKDLEWLYNNDYRAISSEEFISGAIDIPVGTKPVLFTFDDSQENQLSFREDGTVEPNSAVGIMDAFLKEYPDFRPHAVFYVNKNPFRKDQSAIALKYLVSTGREIGNHTIDHRNLAEKSEAGVITGLELLQRHVNELLDSVQMAPMKMRSIAYPFGAVPNAAFRDRVMKGDVKGAEYDIQLGLLVGADPSKPSYHKNYNKYMVPRIQAIDDEWTRWFKRPVGSTARNTVRETFTPFISDGNPYVVTAENRDMIDESRLPQEPAENVEKEMMIDLGNLSVVEGTMDPSLFDVLEDKEPEEEMTVDDSTMESTNETNLAILTEGNEEGTQEVEAEETVVKEKFPYQECEGHEEPSEADERTFTKLDNFLGSFEWNDIPQELVFEGGRFDYVVKEGDTWESVAKKFVAASRFYTHYEFEDAVKGANSGVESLSAEMKIVIPDVPLFWVRPKVSNPPFQGIYLTANSAMSETGRSKIERMLKEGGNTVVFDVKSVAGRIYYPTQVPEATEAGSLSRHQYKDIKKFIRYWQSRGVYMAARLVIFKDEHMAKAKPEWAPRNRNTGGAWQNGEGQVWLDPSNPGAQNYILGLTKELAEMGVDEVQYDYIRFPAMGNMSAAQYHFEKNGPETEKWQVIRNFLKRAKAILKDYDVKFSIDVFGVIVWNNGYDGIGIGQKMECLAPHVDVVYPMIYPSHFGPGFAGRAFPGGEPYFFVNESLKLFQEFVAGTDVEIRPWLQGFSWGAKGYGTGYVQKQVDAGFDEGIYGFVIWNASNRYTESWPVFSTKP